MKWHLYSLGRRHAETDPGPVSATRVQPAEQVAIEEFLRAPGEETFRELFVAIAPKVMGFFRAHDCDPQLSEDLAQEVMLTVYRQAGELRQKEAFRAWLFRIVRNVWLQQIRRDGRKLPTVQLDVEEHESHSTAADPLQGARFLEWMETFDADDRQIMILRYVDGLEYHEIGEVLNMPTGTVQWRIFNCKKKLAARFGQEGA